MTDVKNYDGSHYFIPDDNKVEGGFVKEFRGINDVVELKVELNEPEELTKIKAEISRLNAELSNLKEHMDEDTESYLVDELNKELKNLDMKRRSFFEENLRLFVYTDENGIKTLSATNVDTEEQKIYVCISELGIDDSDSIKAIEYGLGERTMVKIKKAFYDYKGHERHCGPFPFENFADEAIDIYDIDGDKMFLPSETGVAAESNLVPTPQSLKFTKLTDLKDLTLFTSNDSGKNKLFATNSELKKEGIYILTWGLDVDDTDVINSILEDGGRRYYGTIKDRFEDYSVFERAHAAGECIGSDKHKEIMEKLKDGKGKDNEIDKERTPNF